MTCVLTEEQLEKLGFNHNIDNKYMFKTYENNETIFVDMSTFEIETSYSFNNIDIDI